MTKLRQPASYPLRLPKGLKEAVARYAEREGTSMNQFIAIAVAEKLSALDTADFFRERAQRADMDSFWELMTREGGETPRPDDLLPKGYQRLPKQSASST